MIFAMVTVLIAIGAAEAVRRFCANQLTISVAEARLSAAEQRQAEPGLLASVATPAGAPVSEAA